MAEPARVRDYRIDLLRGLALVMIFINHIPGTIWEHLTSRNFGFSDGAEGFVLMSGMATGLAYGAVFLRGATLQTALRPWRRALTLWWVHVLVTLCILALFAWAQHDPAVAAMAVKRNIARALSDPQMFLAPLATLGHQFAYADILPLYIVLMLVAPGLLALAVRWPRGLMVGSLLLWFIAGFTRTTLPTWPLHNGWFFNPLSWQVLFVAGILTGLAMRQGQRWLPVRTWAVCLSWAFLIFALIWLRVPFVASWGGHGLWLLHEYAYFPSILTSFDKSYEFLPRLLHILALGYALSTLPALKTIANSPKVSALILLGQHSLPVFATSTVLAYVAQVTKAMNPPSILLDTALIVGGLAILYAVAWLRDNQKRQLQSRAAA
ncbi:OpgC domain-containing protein [Cypionkella sp.]|uniref:OpgC family protein n=1 Tax=Cypionkella sp. TaxID=2811411 RepID=UPI002AB98171|nr:OpgC domain-containing protein [Cypionkella sp.]MDZ4391668.1 OpgC domain-containing protein [Cypionkella sp.]